MYFSSHGCQTQLLGKQLRVRNILSLISTMLISRRSAIDLSLYYAPLLRVAGDCSVRPIPIPLLKCVAQPHDTITTSADSWGVHITVGNEELCVTPSTGMMFLWWLDNE